MKSPIVKRSIVIGGHKTSVSLEDAFWSGLKEIAHQQHRTMSSMVDDIDNLRSHSNLSSAIRLFVLDRAGVLGPSGNSAGASKLNGGSPQVQI